MLGVWCMLSTDSGVNLVRNLGVVDPGEKKYIYPVKFSDDFF